jgi:hypothetical protein
MVQISWSGTSIAPKLGMPVMLIPFLINASSPFDHPDRRWCLSIADPMAAAMLRLAAADCLDLAEKAERGQVQQQQQIQPKPDDNKDQ